MNKKKFDLKKYNLKMTLYLRGINNCNKLAYVKLCKYMGIIYMYMYI